LASAVLKALAGILPAVILPLISSAKLGILGQNLCRFGKPLMITALMNRSYA